MADPQSLRALHGAVDGHEWSEVVDLLETHWSSLVSTHQSEVRAVLELVPESVMEERPRWIRARDFVRSRSVDVRGGQEDPGGIAALTSRIVELRRAGRARDALPLLTRCRAALSTAPTLNQSRAADDRAEWQYQWARTLEDTGATTEAIAEYEAAAHWAASSPSSARLRSLAGGAAALLAALHGERTRAQRLLAEHRDSEAEPLGGRTSLRLAEALLLFDVLDRDGARRIVDDIDPATIGHRWAHYFHLRTFITWEQRPLGLAHELDTHLTLLGPRPMSALEAGSVRIARYLLLSATMQMESAHDALENSTATSTVLEQFATALHAQELLREGHPTSARRALAPLRTARLGPRAELLTLAVAPERSPLDLERITTLSSENGLYWFLTLLPEHDRDAVSRLLALRDPRTSPAGPLDPSPALATFPLTAREREVALRAAVGETTADIASALHVSINTVKTQLRSSYLKLGVSSRDELYNAVHRTGAG